MLFMLNNVSNVAIVISYRLRFSLSQFYSLRLRRMKRVAPGTIKVAPIFAKKSKIENGNTSSSSSSSRDSNDENERLWKILSWNVAGLRGLAKKNAHKEILSEAADIIFLGEIKCKEWPTELETDFKKYHKTLAISTEKNGGYAGVALLSVVKPLKVWRGIGDAALDKEGRLIIAEFSRFFYIGSYVPNSGRGLVNMDKREKWEMLLLEKIKDLDSKKPVIYTGDLNVAHNEIDLKNPETNRNKTPGFTDKERDWFTTLLETGFTDTFRSLHPNEETYTFWSYLGGSRAKNVGWRLDYNLVSDRIMPKVKSSEMLTEIMGSDHCPIVLNIEV